MSLMQQTGNFYIKLMEFFLWGKGRGDLRKAFYSNTENIWYKIMRIRVRKYKIWIIDNTFVVGSMYVDTNRIPKIQHTEIDVYVTFLVK